MPQKTSIREFLSQLSSDEILELTNDLILAVDAGGQIVYINKNGCKLLEYSQEEVLGKNWFDQFIPESYKTRILKAAAAIMKQDKTYEYYENPVLTKSGKERIFFWHNIPIFGQQGEIIGHLSTGTDVTDFKKAIRATIENEQKFQVFFKENDSVILLIDPYTKKIIDANDAAVKFYGYPKKILLNQTFSDLNVSLSVEPEKEITISPKNGKTHFFMKSRLATNETKDVEIYSGKVKILNKLLWYAIVHDITEQKKLIRSMLKSEQRYQTLFNVLSDAVFVHPWKEKGFGNFIEVNQVACERYGYTAKEFLKLSPADITEKTEIRRQSQAKQRQRLKKTGKVLIETFHYTKSGKKFPVEIHSNFFELEGNAFLLSIVRDITRRKKLEDSLHESEEKYRILVENSLDGIVLVDKKGIIRFANLRVKDFTGVSPRKVIEQSIANFIPEKHLQLAMQNLKRVLSGEHGVSFETEILHKKGTVTPILSNGTKIQFLGKDYSLVVIRDLTKEKEAQKQLKESENKYRLLFDDSILVKMLIEPETGKFIDVNKQAIEFYGYSKKKLLSMTVRDISMLPPKEFRMQIEKALKGKQTYFYSRHRTATGEIKDVKITSNKILINGKPYLLSSISDISDFMEQQFFLKKEHEIARMGSWCFNFNTGKVEACEHARKIYGYDAAENLTIAKVQKIPLPQNRKELDNAIKAAIEEGKEYNVVFQIKRLNDGAIRFIHSIAEYDKDKNELSGIIQDITEQKQVEQELTNRNEEYAAINEEYLAKNEELDDALKKAQESERLKTAFLANMSHEIRTPMNGILGFAELLENTDLTDESRKEFITIIKNSGQQLLGIINDILDYSKLEAGQMKLFLEKIVLADVIYEVVLDFTRRAEEKGLDFIFECFDKIKEIVVETDKTKLIQILNNLLSNALKYTEKGQILLECTIQENYLKFYVRDTGIGIVPEKQKIIFERFRQSDEKLSRKYGGTGLGLAISKGFVQLLGGTIGVESQRGVGSNFWFTIPYHPLSSSTVGKNDKQNSIDDWQEKTFLIVEDYIPNYKLLEFILKPTKARVLFTDTGKKAIEMVQQHPEIDVVLMDIKLPDITGYKATREIRKNNKEVIIIAQTAYAFGNDETEAIKNGCNAYISKPINKDKLMDIIRRAIKRAEK